RLFVDARVPALVEGEDLNVVGGVLLNNALGLVVRVERVHQDEGHANVVQFVEVLEAGMVQGEGVRKGSERPVLQCPHISPRSNPFQIRSPIAHLLSLTKLKTHLDLSDAQVQEGHAVADLDGGFRADTAHGGAKATVQLQDGELVEVLGRFGLGEFGVQDDLFGRGRLNFVPVAGGQKGGRRMNRKYSQLGALGFLVQVAGEEHEEAVHFGLEVLEDERRGEGNRDSSQTHLPRFSVVKLRGELGELDTHGLGSGSGARTLEVLLCGVRVRWLERAQEEALQSSYRLPSLERVSSYQTSPSWGSLAEQGTYQSGQGVRVVTLAGDGVSGL
ncbi:hypothetical protein BC938DRAFT_484004, partial [Jimgerdemannia flammicorona]